MPTEEGAYRGAYRGGRIIAVASGSIVAVAHVSVMPTSALSLRLHENFRRKWHKRLTAIMGAPVYLSIVIYVICLLAKL